MRQHTGYIHRVTMVPTPLLGRAKIYTVFSAEDMNLCPWEIVETSFGKFFTYTGDRFFFESNLILRTGETIENTNLFLFRGDSRAVRQYIERRYTDHIWTITGYNLSPNPVFRRPVRILNVL
jgi:hypothetical protein